jgi:hypothetical protein
MWRRSEGRFEGARRPDHFGASDAELRPTQPYDDLVQLARQCAKQARSTENRLVTQELWRMARGYQRRAADLREGELPDIGLPPLWVTE